MLNKKNIAIAMSAVTVATPFASVFANTLNGTTISVNDNTKVEELKAEIKGYLDVKYTKVPGMLVGGNTADEAVYKVEVQNQLDSAAWRTITSIEDLEVELAKLNNNTNRFLNLKVTDKGHKEVDGEIVNWKEEKYTQTEVAELVDNAISLAVGITDKAKVDENTISLSLQNNEEALLVKTDDVKLDFRAPIYLTDSMGSFLDKEGEVTTTDADKIVIGYQKAKVALDRTPTSPTYDIEEVRNFGVNYEEVITEEFKASDLYDFKADRFEVKGNELVKYINKYNTTATPAGTVTVSKDATSITITLPVEKEVARAASGEFATITITGSTSEIDTLSARLANKGFIIATVSGTVSGTAGKVDVLAGTNRVKTAIEVSKSAFTTANATGNDIVLVSANAIADGLAATPFAKQEQAPILLTGVDAVSTETMEEIARVIATGGKIYLVGGETVISKKVETQLKAAGYANIERIAGKNRYETSLKIAEKMTSTDEVFVTGGYAEADAMSVAGVAARGGNVASTANPILLVDKNGLSQEQAFFLKGKAASGAYVIGGEAKVSSNVEEQLEKVIAGDAERIAGARRQETNAKVIKTFYGAKADIANAYVAKSNDEGLVDALSAGVAAATVDAPVILATNDLDASQVSVLKSLDWDTTVSKKQVGYGIASKVWEAINKMF